MLYVSGDAATRETNRIAMTRERPELTVSTAGSTAAAADVAAATAPDCVVVQPAELGDPTELLSIVDCPTVLAVEEPPTGDGALAEAATTVVPTDAADGAALAERAVAVADDGSADSHGAVGADPGNARTRLLEGLLEEFPGGAVFVVDEAMRYTSAGGSAFEDASIDPEDLVGRTPREVFDPPRAERLERAYRTALDGEAYTYDTQFEGREYEVRTVPLRDHEGTVMAALTIAHDVTTYQQQKRELSETKERLELALEGAELGVWDWNVQTGEVTFDERWAGMLGYVLDDLPARVETWEDLVHPDDIDRTWTDIQTHLDGGTDIYENDHRLRTKDGDYKWIRDIGRVFERDEDGDPVRAVGIHQDITERKKRQREVAAQRDELATLARVQSLIQDVIRALGSAATRDEIETTLCERLVESDLFEFAWVGEPTGADDRIAVRTSAGGEADYLDLIHSRADEETRANGPGARAFETGETQVVDDVRAESTMSGWHAEALDRGFRSAAVVPLRHEEAVHGILVVYAARTGAFGDRVVESFEVLGETVGFVVGATQTRQLLSEDRVLELEFAADGTETCLAAVAQAHGCRFEATGCVPVDDQMLQYLDVSGAPAERVVDDLRDRAKVLEARVVRSDDDGGALELRTTETYQSLLLDVGARPVEVTADETGTTVTVEAPTDAEPRTIRERLAEAGESFTLTAKQERERGSIGPPDESTLRDRLTDRQQEVLRAAFLAGYYEWPRDTTAEQLSETLDISSPTLHQHLRRAQRNLLDALFDG
ncbi:bacterio-opsin activator domain-containing protein [Haloarcula litorea]|uniref:bacterio-opsin activator domain-containing protein n=1 Tax=Haloarcula litorea TaxID=3032579 RepID=UPI0023E7C348|nr:bacterio-opsin activator domain-containing protein [Halomicroarcula sp. GDY20]